MIRYKNLEIQFPDIGKHIDKEVAIWGRIVKKQNLGKKLSFMNIATHLGEIQVVSEGVEVPRIGSIIKIDGTLKSCHTTKADIKNFEVLAKKIDILYASPEIKSIKSNLKTRVENRHISLREKIVAQLFKAKSESMQIAREFLTSSGFLEIYSSKLVGASSEGRLEAFSVDYFEHKVFLSVSNTLFQLDVLAGGLPKVFEIGPCFVGTKSKTQQHVNEYITLDFSASFMTREEFMKISENMIILIISKLAQRDNEKAKIISQEFAIGDFEIITYRNAVKNTKTESRNALRIYLKKNFKSFVWIIDFPETEKSFYVKSRNVEKENLCYNFQLWHPDIGNLMDGAERNTCPEEAVKKIIQKKLNPQNFNGYLKILQNGLPPCTGAGLAFDRFMQFALGLENIREIILFPRDNQLIPR